MGSALVVMTVPEECLPVSALRIADKDGEPVPVPGLSGWPWKPREELEATLSAHPDAFWVLRVPRSAVWDPPGESGVLATNKVARGPWRAGPPFAPALPERQARRTRRNGTDGMVDLAAGTCAARDVRGAVVTDAHFSEFSTRRSAVSNSNGSAQNFVSECNSAPKPDLVKDSHDAAKKMQAAESDALPSLRRAERIQ